MDDVALQTVYRSVVIAKLQYSSSAWSGFTNTSDRQRVEASIRRSARCNFAPALRQIAVRLKNCAEPPTSGCSTASSATNTTFCITYCRRKLKHLNVSLNVTICARAHRTLNYQNAVRVSQTAVTLNDCYSRIFIKCCSTSLTELTVLTVN